jgi:glycosyltransferase involved in cell wall biosynthesis
MNQSAKCAISVSVVMPTYNRGAKLAETLQRLLASDLTNLIKVEIVVVDDGSETPAAPVVEAQCVPAGFRVTCLRQKNAGPATARNLGFRATTGKLVLFMDDDILVPTALLQQHVAAHQKFPGSVIFGRSPFRNAPRKKGLARLVNSLGYSNPTGQKEFEDVEIIASGHISVPRHLFSEQQMVYRDDLATPAAEEFELSARLAGNHVRMIVANNIVADHDHDVTIDGLCRQAFKHGMGAAEYGQKCEDRLMVVDNILRVNGPIRQNDSWTLAFTKRAKALLMLPPVRGGLEWILRVSPEFSALDRLMAIGYRGLLGVNFFAGVRAGLSKYGRS